MQAIAPLVPTTKKSHTAAIHRGSFVPSSLTATMDNDIPSQIQRDLEAIGINQLTNLGNRAIELGLIAGHGYHQGQYELIRDGKILLMTPEEATAYLADLIQSAEG